MDCVQHVIHLVGADHVGIGSDLCDDLSPTTEAWASVYGPNGTFPEITGGLGAWYRVETNMAEGLDTIADFPNVREQLVLRGFEPIVISKVLGLNLLRVFEAVTGGKTVAL